MKDQFQYTIRAVEEWDRKWILDLMTTKWGGNFVVVHEEVFYPDQLPAFIAENLDGTPIGLVTYHICSTSCEIITLDSLIENQGVGSALVETVIEEIQGSGCDHICLTTTNDNQRAIDFYTNRGFQLKEIRRGAVEKARNLKPSIPQFSPTGISIQDEWEFEKFLSGRNDGD
jgi:GNAT superfamily N-acetyltransferase